MEYEEFEKRVPTVFSVETVLACDLRCPECAIGGGYIGRKNGVMTLPQFDLIAGQISPFAKYVYLHLWGEPLLNPDIVAIVRRAAMFSRCHLSTHGQGLTRELAEQIIAAGVSDVIVSIDGVSQGVYEQYRVGGRVDAAFAGLRHLVTARRALNKANDVSIKPQFLVLKHNEHEMEQFRQECEWLGLEPSFKAPYVQRHGVIEQATDPSYRRPDYDSVTATQAAMTACSSPVEDFTILNDGSVVMCCNDSDGRMVYGNIFTDPVLAIWNSATFKAARWDVVRGSAPQNCIDTCLQWTFKGRDAALMTLKKRSA